MKGALAPGGEMLVISPGQRLPMDTGQRSRTGGVLFFACRRPSVIEHTVLFKIVRRLHG